MRQPTVTIALLSFLLVGAACAPDAPDEADSRAIESPAPESDAPHGELAPEQEAFWSSLESLCDEAYEGEVLEAAPGDTVFTGRRLVMHVRECDASEIRIPFHVDEDRSRTWVITRTDDGLRLKHDHRHEDGTEDEITQYGGDTAGPGGATRQEFPADEHTAELVPEAATNVWTVEVEPGERFVYALRREGTDRRVRIAFDLSRTVEPPPAPWGMDLPE